MNTRLNDPPEDDDEALSPEQETAAPVTRPWLPPAVSDVVARVTHFFATREPRWMSFVLVLPAICVLLGLGTWQVLRMQEKNLLLAQVRETLQTAPQDISLTTPLEKARLADLHMKPVTMTGSWESLRMFRLAPRTYEHQNGYHLLIPFRLENGLVVFVNRGFVPEGVSSVPPVGGAAADIQGIAYRPAAEKPRFVPENNPAKGAWVWMDLAAMAHEAGMAQAAPIVVYENRHPDSSAYPIGGQVPLPYHNRHRQYAVTWYCMAFVLMGVWLMAIGPKPKKPEEEKNAQMERIEDMDPVARRDRYPEATD